MNKTADQNAIETVAVSTYSNVNNIEKMKKWPLKVILSSCTWRSNIVNFLGGLFANSDANVCVEKYWPVLLYYQSICIEKCGSVSLFYQQRDEHVYTLYTGFGCTLRG